jgi:hypothetical protein
VRASVRYYELSVDGLNGPNEFGAFEYGRCLQYGIGLDVSLEDAADFYGLPAIEGESESARPSFRCLRSLHKAVLAALPPRRTAASRVENREYSHRVRKLAAPQMLSDYLTDPIGPGEGGPIATGGSSQVRLVRDPATGKTISVKYFSGRNLSETPFIREVEFLSTLNHPCVLRIIAWALPEGSRCGEIHMEFAERKSLEDVVNRRQVETEKQFWTETRIGIVICAIVLGMKYVHLHHIIHHDLKPSNILIRSNGRAMIGDFGSSRLSNDDWTLRGESGTIR